MQSQPERIARLEAVAREHKRAVAFHRRKLRTCMEELARLRAQCESLGIGLTRQSTGEEETHGQGPAQLQDH